MSFPAGQDDLSAVCPYLGLADDADSHATYPTEAHRCYRLDNPTRIATGHQESYCLGANHVACPVYRGEGIGATTAPAAGAAAAAASAPERPSRGGGRPPRESSGRAAMPGSRPRNTDPANGGKSPALGGKRPSGSLGPRPRPGGISMPVATVGLFVLAIVILGLAVLLSNAIGGDDDDGEPADGTSTVDTRTATPGNGTQTQQPGTATRTLTPGATTTGTPGATQTQAGAGTHTVASGDTCGSIATAAGITLDQFYDLNPDIDADCTNLAVGQVVRTR
ncbi:MAG: LysM peptidoglycan-binding domain-containing protein [Dehalococcoidia bacterium]|nr:LysM peptidoglycan-binding domain-containing protein [Dehalococcoidia bacterium]